MPAAPSPLEAPERIRTAGNFYDYAAQDPINGYDLTGTMLAIAGTQERDMQEDRDALIADSTLLFGQFGPTIGDVAEVACSEHLKNTCKANDRL
jgi:hypothetical protein